MAMDFFLPFAISLTLVTICYNVNVTRVGDYNQNVTRQFDQSNEEDSRSRYDSKPAYIFPLNTVNLFLGSCQNGTEH